MLMPPIRLSLLTSSGFIDYERSFFRSVTHLDLGDVKDMSLGLLQPNPWRPHPPAGGPEQRQYRTLFNLLQRSL